MFKIYGHLLYSGIKDMHVYNISIIQDIHISRNSLYPGI